MTPAAHLRPVWRHCGHHPARRPADAAALETAVSQEVAQKSYVLDTSVLLSDPKAVLRFAEHEVIIPIVVISELEKKRHDSELGYYARSALRLLDELRTAHGALNQPVPLNSQGGHLLVELNHISQEVLLSYFRGRRTTPEFLRWRSRSPTKGGR